MIRRVLTVLFLAALVLGAASCTNKKVKNPIANLDSKQPDKVLFDRSMDAMKHNKYDVARMTLQTLINTYPDSEYVARAKLAVGDSWYAEGGAAALAQAEIEYKDFITFFPNMPEAAEAQLKVANIHYKQMEKPDRDFTHAMRAEEEYKQLILQWPDSKLVPEAKQRLREVQEVLAEREYRIGHFYFMREMYPAAIARLESLADAYPLYSKADETLYTLGQSYEHEIELIRNSKLPDKAKEKLISEYTQKAGQAYTRLITRYPVMDRAKDAAERLAALHLPVPTPTPQAIAQNKEEEASRGKTGTFGNIMGNFRHGPDVSASAKVGEPTMVEPQPADASAMVRDANNTVKEAVLGASPSSNTVSVEAVSSGSGTPGPNQPPPTSDNGAAAAGDSNGAPAGQELTPSSSTGDSGSQAAPLPPMTQVNEAAQPSGSTSAQTGSAQAGQQAAPANNKQESSSKSKKKKGLRKLIPF